jgi:hypothetical protein
LEHPDPQMFPCADTSRISCFYHNFYTSLRKWSKKIAAALSAIDSDMLQRVCDELNYRIYVSLDTGALIDLL